jgi:ornithine cyclodeaminase
LRLLGGADLRAALPMPAAIEAMQAAFVAIARGTVQAHARGVAQHGDALLLGMGAVGAGLGAVSKAVTVVPGRGAQAMATLFDGETGAPVALLDGTALTAWRTGAAAGLATRLLAPADARIGAVIGGGRQCRSQALALDAVRELEELRVHDHHPGRAADVVAGLREVLRARVVVAASAAAALDGAHVVTSVTTSREPVFDDRDLAPGAHVNGMGSFRLDMREVPEDTLGRALIFVDEVAACLAEAGELVAAEAAGRTTRDAWVELGRVAAGEHPGRARPGDLTFFKSVGHAAQDLYAAARACAAALELGLGREVEL